MGSGPLVYAWINGFVTGETSEKDVERSKVDIGLLPACLLRLRTYLELLNNPDAYGLVVVLEPV